MASKGSRRKVWTQTKIRELIAAVKEARPDIDNQTKFAAHIGVTQALVSLWLSGQREPAAIHEIVLNCRAKEIGFVA